MYNVNFGATDMQREIKWNHTKYSRKTKEGIMRQKEKQGKSATRNSYKNSRYSSKYINNHFK